MKFTFVFVVATAVLSASPSFAAPTVKENRSLESVGEAPVLSRELINAIYGRELTDVELQEREPFLGVFAGLARVGITAARIATSAARVGSTAARAGSQATRAGSQAAKEGTKAASRVGRKVVKDEVKDQVKNQNQQQNNQQNNNNAPKKEHKEKHHKPHHRKHHGKSKRSLDVRDEYADFLEERDWEELLDARDFFDEEVYEERDFDDLD